MHPHHAPAWRADWINGWLAAIGCTVLCDDLRLSWTDDAHPTAILWTPDDTTIEHFANRIAEAFPPIGFIATTSARHLTAQVPTELQYAIASDEARRSGDWLWSSLFTDLGPTKQARIARSTFYPGTPGPNGISQRTASLAKTWAEPAAVMASMLGQLPRSKGTGLGFDPRRIMDPAEPKGEITTDPIVEALALFATIMFPTRGSGSRALTRGERYRQPFRWNTWTDALDFAGIDAQFASSRSRGANYEVVPYEPRGNETNAAYFSRKLQS